MIRIRLIWLILVFGFVSCMPRLPQDESAEVEIERAQLLYYTRLDEPGHAEQFQRNKRIPGTVRQYSQLVQQRNLQSESSAQNQVPEISEKKSEEVNDDDVSPAQESEVTPTQVVQTEITSELPVEARNAEESESTIQDIPNPTEEISSSAPEVPSVSTEPSTPSEIPVVPTQELQPPKDTQTSEAPGDTNVVAEKTAPLNEELPQPEAQVTSSDNICLSPECIHSASKMIGRMNFSMDPCQDFYEFACGGFIENTHVEPTQTSINIFSIINDKLVEQLRDMLSEPIDEQFDIMPIKVIKNLYAGCMNQELIEARGEKPLFDMLQQLGGWPILTGPGWTGTRWTWTDTIARMKMMGVGFDQIVAVTVLNDFMNSEKRILYIDQPTFELERDFLIKGWNETNVMAYYTYIKEIALVLQGDRACVEKEAREIVNFEIALAEISASKESRRDLESLYNPLTIRELQKQHPYVNWLDFINLLLPQGVRVDDTQIVSLADKEFFVKLGPLLDRTPKRVIANYLLWRAVDGAILFLTSKLRNIEIQYRTKVEGKEQRDAQWKECVMHIAPEFKIAVGAKYIRKYFREDSKAVAVEMVSDIKGAFEEIINTRAWMDDKTKELANEKLQRMSVNIAYPSELMDDNIMIEYYKGLHVKKDEFFESYLRSYAWLSDKMMDRLHEPVNKTDWRDLAYVAVVNAFYHPIMNYIMFPAGILQDHFFDRDRPKYMNYAAIGFVIGHEISHGFDDMGNQFDVEGNLRHWWDNDTLNGFSERANCMVEQYSNFIDPEVNLPLNGVNTQGENIADSGGLKEAYLAYQTWVQKHGEERALPGLNYTTNQLFWISAAQTWCSVYRPATLKYTIISDPHSPGRFRVLGPFMNSLEFPKDFGCPRGSPMNPEHKCEVW